MSRFLVVLLLVTSLICVSESGSIRLEDTGGARSPGGRGQGAVQLEGSFKLDLQLEGSGGPLSRRNGVGQLEGKLAHPLQGELEGNRGLLLKDARRQGAGQLEESFKLDLQLEGSGGPLSRRNGVGQLEGKLAHPLQGELEGSRGLPGGPHRGVEKAVGQLEGSRGHRRRHNGGQRRKHDDGKFRKHHGGGKRESIRQQREGQ